MSRQSLLALGTAITIAGAVTISAHILQANATPEAAAELVSSATVEVPAVFPTGVITVQLRNTGTIPWIREGFAKEAVNLGTVKPDNGDSPFYDPTSWHSPNRIALVEAAVAPGEVGSFTFRLAQPLRSFNRQQFRLVREHVGPFGPVVTLSTVVVAQESTGTSVPIDVVEPQTSGPLVPPPTVTFLTKRVDVNLSTNTLTTYENDVQVASWRISPGKGSTPTPRGEFKIYNKSNVAYSKSYSLYMPYWNSFTASGAYGIHGLPYWKTRRGGIVVEGANHIGRNVSHGCIRLPAGADAEFFSWADPGTPISIHR